MADEMMEQEEEKKGFFAWLKSVFGGKKEEEGEEEQPQYKRRLLDGRIEKYLDQNLDSYVQEYGIVTGIDLESYEERYGDLTKRIVDMKEYMIDADAKVTSMEKDLDLIKAAAKKGRKK